MNGRPWHKRFHGDAITGYMGLTLEERGAYSTFLDYLYDRGEPLTGNMRMLAGFLDVSVRKAEAVIESLLEKGKLRRLEDGRLTNDRFERERENSTKTSDHMAEIGSAGGRKSAEQRKKPNKNNETGKRPLTPRSSYPEARDQKEEKEAPKGAVPALELEFQFPTWWPQKAWDAYCEMRKRIKVPTGERARDMLIAAVTRCKEDLGQDPAAVLDKATLNGWKSVFPLKPGDAGFGGNGRQESGPEVAVDTALWTRRLAAFYRGDEEWGVEKGYWQAKWGPKPGVTGCVAPQEAMRAFRARHPAGVGG